MSTRTDLDSRDAILQAHAPALMVPRYGALPMMEKSGHRYLIAGDGVWLEVLRPWLQARVNLGPTELPLPFGELTEIIQHAFSRSDIETVRRRFLEDAVRAFPNECAAWAVYDEISGQLEYRPLIADEASPASVSFHRPRLADHEHLAIDLHSHGALAAGFSGTDDADDEGEVKFAVVAGNLDSEITFASRLCLLGLFIDYAAQDLVE